MSRESTNLVWTSTPSPGVGCRALAWQNGLRFTCLSELEVLGYSGAESRISVLVDS